MQHHIVWQTFGDVLRKCAPFTFNVKEYAKHRKSDVDIGRSTGAGALSKSRGIRKMIKEYAALRWIIFKRYKDLEK